MFAKLKLAWLRFWHAPSELVSEENLSEESKRYCLKLYDQDPEIRAAMEKLEVNKILLGDPDFDLFQHAHNKIAEGAFLRLAENSISSDKDWVWANRTTDSDFHNQANNPEDKMDYLNPFIDALKNAYQSDEGRVMIEKSARLDFDTDEMSDLKKCIIDKYGTNQTKISNTE